jgi:hypothetical protein
MFCEGKCQACIGRAKTAKELEIVKRYRIDVADTRNYELVHNGPYQFRRLKLVGLIAAA